MSIIDSKTYSVALTLCKTDGNPTPEQILYGYARLITLDEANIKLLLGEQEIRDLEKARTWFNEQHLDAKLIKSGIQLLIPLAERIFEEGDRLEYILTKGEKIPASDEILNSIFTLVTVDFNKVFSDQSKMDDVFEEKDRLKQIAEEKRAKEKAQKETTKATLETENKDSSANKKEESKTCAIKENEDDTKEDEKATSKEEDFSEVELTKEVKMERLSGLSEKYFSLNSALLNEVKGQDNAILKFLLGYNQGELLKKTQQGNRPRSYFFFFGPPGVGKTFLAETAAKSLGIPHKTYNMSEFATSSSYEELIGISTFYNHAKEGSLVKFVRENPECILVFDEIEKAHINVIRLFLQVLSSGTMHNVYKDKDESFKDAMIIFTSNVGRDLYEDRSVNLTTLPQKVIIDAIRNEEDHHGNKVFPPELVSRIASGNAIMFNHLSVRHLVDMINESFEEVVIGMEKEYGIKITYSSYLPLLFLYHQGDEMDARIAKRQSLTFLKNEIYELLRQLENSRNSKPIDSIHFDIQWDGMEPELKGLFNNEEKSDVLLFTSDEYDFSEVLSTDKYNIIKTSDINEAREILKGDIVSVFIDPYFGYGSDDDEILSISDYNTPGVRFFRELTFNQTTVPIYIIETERELSKTDKKTFIQFGAAGTKKLNKDNLISFKRELLQTLDEIYMEKETQVFSQRGWIIDFNTKQLAVDENGRVNIFFYDLKKRRAIDIDSKNSILSDAQKPTERFEDVIGASNAKEELKYFVEFLKNPKRFLMNGGRAPKGVLLYGPPGTGKTMLAKAMAGESGVTFLPSSASEFKNMYVGESEANIRRIFKKARKYAPSIIFIDEIDAIGKKRMGSDGAHTSESMLNALLTEMEGFKDNDPTKPVFVLAATNFGVNEDRDGALALDEALIRRFDNKIYVDLPKESERKEYLLLQLKKRKLDTISEATAESIAERTTGQSLAVLQNVLELAVRRAGKEMRKPDDSDLLTALEEYNYGEKKNHKPDYYKSVAVHEVGHAFVSYLGGDKPSYITIESRGNFGGYMQHSNDEETTEYTKEELLSRIRTSLAGRAAEQVFFGKDKAINTSASSDLEHATRLAFQMLLTYGMDDGNLVVLKRDEVLKSALAGEYVSKVNEILSVEMANTIKIIENSKEKIKAISDILAKENRLTGKEFEKLMEE